MNVNYEDLEPIIGAALKKANTANERIDNLPLPMVFKGTLGTGGTISTLPTASSENEGYVYIVITDGTYAGQSAKAGDTFVSDGSSWVLVPSADEPSVIDDSVTSTALTWSSKKISDECKVKTFTYIGNGTVTREITFPVTPKYIFTIQGNSDSSTWGISSLIIWGVSPKCTYRGLTSGSVAEYLDNLSYDGNKLTITGPNSFTAFNTNGSEYTVLYI